MAKALIITTNKQNTEYKWNVVERNGNIEELGKILYTNKVSADDLDFDTLLGSIRQLKNNGDYIPSGRRDDILPGYSTKIKDAIMIADKLKITNIYMYDEAIFSWTYYSVDNNSWDLVSSYLKNPNFDPSQVQKNRFKF